jgi:hypothetical protein
MWGVSPIEIERDWTDDLFFMMLDRLCDRVDRENKKTKKTGHRGNAGAGNTGTSERTTVDISRFIDVARKAKAAQGSKAEAAK